LEQTEPEKQEQQEKNAKQQVHFTLVTKHMPLVYGYIPPLMLAILHGNVALARTLQEHGADCYIHLAPMAELASEPEDTSSVRILDAINAQIVAADKREQELKKRLEAQQMLAESGNGASPAMLAAASREQKDIDAEMEEASSRLDQYKADREAKTRILDEATTVYAYFCTPLLLAVYCNNTEIVHLLLQQELSLRSDAATPASSTLIGGDYSSSAAHTSILLQKNTEGMRAVDLAAEYNLFTLALLLLEWEAKLDVNPVHKFNKTHLYFKMMYKNEFSLLCSELWVQLVGRKARKLTKLKAD
jgi:ankyrin repeat protein